MTEQRVCANGEGSLERYIQDCQDMASLISSVIESAEVIDNEGTYPNGVTALLRISGEMANKLASKLDSVKISKVQT
ncbi:hypothetical protein [uncultured Ruegeria sp.]|uniref:hypothetical protein n=1 Tax=uncultured Ruegeria sp. TaxID=259304 RepID=UPI00263052E5|nr:hypothetical protein [uncultured Ruegeria sp.]